MAGLRIEGNISGNVAEVNSLNALKIVTETNAFANPGNVGGLRIFAENDRGALTGLPKIYSPEVDVDFRQRISSDLILDDELFCMTAQNTGKHSYPSTTMTGAFSAGQFTTNNGNILTTTTGIQLTTYSFFPYFGTQTLWSDMEVGFSAQPTANTFVEFGIGIATSATAAPSDGVFFRLSSAGIQGIASFNGTETSTGVFPAANGIGTWTYVNNKRYQFIVYISAVRAEFWVNDGTDTYLLGTIQLPSGQGRITMAQSGHFFYKHRITGGAAGAVLQSFLNAYTIGIRGSNLSTIPSTQGNRIYGSYQGLSGGVMGSLANYVNSTNPTAAIPTNTTAALGTGLGGQFWETDTLAANTDGIICSFQNPVGTVNAPGRRLVIKGVSLASHIQTALTGGGYVAQLALCFGHTNVSLATAESPQAKAPRRKALPQFTQIATAGQLISTGVSQPGGCYIPFSEPIYVNPGEFVALSRKKIGAIPTAGVIAHVIDFDYGWE